MKDRDIKLLIILGIVAVLALPYVLLVKPKDEQIDAVDAEIVALTDRLNYLNGLNEQRDFFLGEIVRLNDEKAQIISKFAPGLRQENTIMFLVDAEYSIPIQMYTLGFGYTDDTIISLPFGEGDAFVDGLTGKCAVTTVSYLGSYESVKKLLSYIKNYNERMVISSISIAPSAQVPGMMTGAFTLQQYAITGQGKELPPAEIPEVVHGNNNIFFWTDPNAENPTEVVGNDYGCDYFLFLNPKDTPAGTKVMGRSGDGAGSSLLVNSSNSEQSMRVTFRKAEDKVYASYAIGTAKYPIENYDLGEEFTVNDGVINFNIFSSTRIDGDKVGANIKFFNETDIPVVISVSNDDSVDPRVNITETSGDVKVE